MRKVKTAVIGTGFMGKVHSEAIRRLGNVDIAAVVGSNAEDRRGIRRSLSASNGPPAITRKFWPTARSKQSTSARPNAQHYPMSKACSGGGEGGAVREAVQHVGRGSRKTW